MAAKAAQMNIFQPPKAYMDQYKDPSFFNYAHQKYLEDLKKEQTDDDNTTVASSKGYSSNQEDRNDEADDTPPMSKASS